MSEVNKDQVFQDPQKNYLVVAGLVGAGVLAVALLGTSPPGPSTPNLAGKAKIGKLDDNTYMVVGGRPPVHEDIIKVSGKNVWLGKFGPLLTKEVPINFNTKATFRDCTSTATAYSLNGKKLDRIETDNIPPMFPRVIVPIPAEVTLPNGRVFDCQTVDVNHPREADFHLNKLLSMGYTYEGAHPIHALKFTSVVQETA